MDGLVTTEWLAQANDVLVLDATYSSTIPGSPPRNPLAEFEAEHIEGARFLDLDTLTSLECKNSVSMRLDQSWRGPAPVKQLFVSLLVRLHDLS